MENQPTIPLKPKPPVMAPLIVIIVIITAVITGGGVYLWQSSFAKTLLDKAKNNEQALRQQLNNLKSTLTNLSDEKIQDVKDSLSDYQEVYFKDTAVKITLPKNLQATNKIVNHYYNPPNSSFSISLIGENDEVMGHPFTKNLNNYCENEIVKNIKYNDCEETVLNGRKLITMYEANDDPNDNWEDFYYYRKYALVETGITEYPILFVMVNLPDLYTYQWQGMEFDNFQEHIYNIKNLKIPYTTKIVLDDFDFILNNLEISQNNLTMSALPSGYIMSDECQSQGGDTFQADNCNNTAINLEMTNLGKFYGEEGLICCKL